METYPVVEVDSARAESTESLGAKPKFWFIDDSNSHMLFKAENRNTGEDWAEKIVSELATLLGLPHVSYDLAQEINGNRGELSVSDALQARKSY